MASDRDIGERASALVAAAMRLESALATYRAARPPDRQAARAMADAFAALMRTALPAARAEVHAALVTLCATETARARAAAASEVPAAVCRVLDIVPKVGAQIADGAASHEPAPEM
jgi:hypothetical protein